MVVNALAVADIVAVIILEFFGQDDLPDDEYWLGFSIAFAINVTSAQRMLETRQGRDGSAEIGA